MKKGKKYGITDWQLLALIVGAILGGGITTMPRTVAETAGRDGWLSIGLGGAAVLLLGILIWLLCARFPTKTLPEFSILILGKPLGIVVSIIYALYALTMAGVALRLYIELVINWIMPWTPVWVFATALLIPAVYAARTGAISLARTMELVLYLTLVAMVLFVVPLGEFKLNHLRPVGGEGFLPILSGAPEAAFGFLGFEVLLVLFPFVVERKKILRVYLMALAAVTVFYMANSVMIYGTLGIENTTVLIWPLINYLRVGSLPILERTDNVVMFLWFAQVAAVAAIHYFVGTFTLATLTKHSHHDLWAILAWPWTFFVSIAPNRLVHVFSSADMTGRYSFIFIILLVLLLLIVALVRRLDERTKANE